MAWNIYLFRSVTALNRISRREVADDDDSLTTSYDEKNSENSTGAESRSPDGVERPRVITKQRER